MRAGIVIVREVGSQNSLQVGFVQHDHMIEALSADAANYAFAERILPWRARGGGNFLDAHTFDTVFEIFAVDCPS